MKHKIAASTFVLAALLFGTIPPALAQTGQPTLNVAPTTLVNGSPTAAMTFPDGSSLSMRSQNGRFPLVAAGAGQGVTIQLRFVPDSNNAGLTVAALDGGTVPQGNISVAADGTASIQFQPGTQPGLYRVLLNQGGNMSLLQFWVPEPPDAGPPTLQPQ